MASDEDIRDVAYKVGLTYNDLHKLYGELHLSLADINREERNSDTRDYSIQAEHILSYWRKKNGKVATRKTILDALQECHNKEAIENLEGKWRCTVAGKFVFPLPQDSWVFLGNEINTKHMPSLSFF